MEEKQPFLRGLKFPHFNTNQIFAGKWDFGKSFGSNLFLGKKLCQVESSKRSTRGR